jgi:hypothetical protein
MNPPNQSSKKWIPLAALILFLMAGGAYKLLRSQSPSSQENTVANQGEAKTEQTNAANQADPAVEAKSASHPGTESTAVSKSASASKQHDAAESTSTSGTAQSAQATHAGDAVAKAPVDAPKGGILSFFSGLFGGGKAPAVSAPVTGAVSGAPATGGVAATASTGSSDAGKNARAPAPVAEKDACVTVTYKHKAMASHNDEETCSHHKNWLKLGHANVNAKTVCVRVNGSPVHFVSIKGHNDEVVFGSVAGPKSNVTVTYCTGKLTGCEAKMAMQDCVVPKDEFMEAIGGESGGKPDARLGQWDPAHPSEKEADVLAKLDGSVRRELETNDELNGRAPAGEMFKDWLAGTETSACGTQQASN